MTGVWSLKRFTPLRRSLFQLRSNLRRRFALRPSASVARATIRAVQDLKARNPGRPVYGILLVEHIGDIIACEPVIGWAREQCADAVVVWVTRTSYAPLLEEHPGLDLLLTVESLASIAPIVRSGVFDVAIDLHINWKPTGVADVVHIKEWGDPAIDFDTYVREGSLLRALSKAAGIEQFGRQPTLYVSSETRSAVNKLRLPPQYVAVHVASNDPARDWSIDEWLRLTKFVIEECGLPVIEVGLRPILSAREPSVASLAGKLSIMETAEVIRRASFFIGVDSGPAHMANALRRPALILLGRFRGCDWSPYEGFFLVPSSQRLLRHGEQLATLSAARVIERLRLDGEWRRLAK
jgi:heptosyltransferase-3